MAVFGLLVGWLFACDGDVTGPDERRIGPAGGTAILANGAIRISVPPGALYEEIWFTVTPGLNVPESELYVDGSAWEIGPPGTAFALPATVTITYNPGSVPVGLGEAGLGVFKVNGGAWSLMANTTANPGSHTASGQISTLGRFGVGGLTVASMSMTPASAFLAPNDTAALKAIPRASDGRSLDSRTVVWSSSDPEIASVTGSGLVTGKAQGTATITASCEQFEAEASVVVTIPTAEVVVSPSNALMNLSQTLQLVGEAKSADGTVLSGRPITWMSSNPTVATVDGNGLVISYSVGSATISAISGGHYGTATIGVHSMLGVLTNTLADGVARVAYSQTLAASGGNGTYQWSVSEGYLPIGLSLLKSSGEIKGTPTSSGTHSFTVQVESGGQVATKAVTIYVSPVPVASVAVTPNTVTLTPSETRQLTATVLDASGNPILDRTVVWATGDASVVTVSSMGLLTAKGMGSTTVTANVDGQPGWASVSVHNLLTVLDTELEAGVMAGAYSQTLDAAGGDGHYVWSVSAGSLPTGLTLQPSTGLISGTPSSSGSFSFVVQVLSNDGQRATAGFFIMIHGELAVTTAALAEGAEAAPYSETLNAAGGEEPFFWTLVSDTLPTGLNLDGAEGTISGTPLTQGSSTFTLQVESADGQSASKEFSITIQAVPVASVELTPVTASAAIGQTQLFTAILRDAAGNELTGRSIIWSSSDQTVATVSQAGVATGVAVGSSTIIATAGEVTDMANFTVYSVLGVTTGSLADGVSGSAYSQTLAATGGNGTYVWSLASGALPDGLSLADDTGVISGTPTAPGTSNFTVQVVSGAQTATRALTITIG